jgi:hypothetical protein
MSEEKKPEERKPPAVPDWLIKLILGGSAIGVGGYIIYYFVSGGEAARAARQELEYWTAEYARELKEITDKAQIPTPAEETALKLKAERMEATYNQLFKIYNVARDVLLAAIGTAATVWLISKLAKDYWKTHVTEVKTPQSAIQLLREAHAIDLHAMGQTTLAVAMHTQTQYAFTTLYTPLIQAEIATLTAQLPTLTGTQLLWTQYLIQSLQIEMSTIIPAMMSAAGAILALPPPMFAKNYKTSFPRLYDD